MQNDTTFGFAHNPFRNNRLNFAQLITINGKSAKNENGS